jgi:hypothetical protein
LIRKMSARETAPRISVHGLVWSSSAINPANCSNVLPLTAGTPNNLGNWPTAMVMARPNTKPVTTDLDRKSEMKPRRAIPASSSKTPTVRARAAVSARYRSTSPPAIAATTAADIAAMVELAVTLSWRLEPKTA